LGGHGTGAKLALATGCYHADRVTGKILNQLSNEKFVK